MRFHELKATINSDVNRGQRETFDVQLTLNQKLQQANYNNKRKTVFTSFTENTARQLNC